MNTLYTMGLLLLNGVCQKNASLSCLAGGMPHACVCCACCGD